MATLYELQSRTEKSTALVSKSLGMSAAQRPARVQAAVDHAKALCSKDWTRGASFSSTACRWPSSRAEPYFSSTATINRCKLVRSWTC